MPNLKKMLNHSFNFSNHYSFFNEAGSTFGSDMAVATGFTSPYNYDIEGFFFSKNTFKNTLATEFKKEGYIVNIFHNNKGSYYGRVDNYKAWGYDNYYGLLDDFDDEKITCELDTHLSRYFDEMLPTDKKFVSSIVTMSIHMPFNYSNIKTTLLSDNKNLNEEDIIKLYAKESDDFLGLLLEELDKRNLSNNTIIVLYGDHFLYTVNDKNIIINKKGSTSIADLDKTPLIIYNKNIEPKTIDKINSQLDILPTILNLYGIKYNTNNYIGEDIFDSNYEGLVIYPDLSYRDKNGLHSIIDKHYLDEKVKQNDLTLLSNYFK